MTAFWIDAPRENFSRQCMERFACTFDAPVFIVRSEYVKPERGCQSHRLRKYPIDPKTGDEARRQARIKHHRHVGSQMSAKAMQSASLLAQEAWRLVADQ